MTKSIKQFLSFAAIGAVGTGGHYLTLIILVEVVTYTPVYASLFGFIVGAAINYILNYHITFQSNKPHKEALTKFLIVATVGALMNTLIMYIGYNILLFHYIIVQIMATVLVLLWNFGVNKIWTFHQVQQSNQG